MHFKALYNVTFFDGLIIVEANSIEDATKIIKKIDSVVLSRQCEKSSVEVVNVVQVGQTKNMTVQSLINKLLKREADADAFLELIRILGIANVLEGLIKAIDTSGFTKALYEQKLITDLSETLKAYKQKYEEDEKEE